MSVCIMYACVRVGEVERKSYYSFDMIGLLVHFLYYRIDFYIEIFGFVLFILQITLYRSS